jgi:hypothetical protein
MNSGSNVLNKNTTGDVLSLKGAEHKFIHYYTTADKRKQDELDLKRKNFADNSCKVFLDWFRDDLVKVGVDPETVTPKIQDFKKSIVIIDNVWIFAEQDKDHETKFYIGKKCRKCGCRYQEYKYKESIGSVEDIGRLLADDSDEHLCWGCHKDKLDGELDDVQDNS